MCISFMNARRLGLVGSGVRDGLLFIGNSFFSICFEVVRCLAELLVRASY